MGIAYSILEPIRRESAHADEMSVNVSLKGLKNTNRNMQCTYFWVLMG